MTRVRRDFGASNHLRASRGGGKASSLTGLRIVSLQYPALEALGYNTSPLWGCSPFTCPQNGVPLGACRILRLRSGFRLAARFLACPERKPKGRENGSTWSCF